MQNKQGDFSRYRSEGDLNVSPRRTVWQEDNIDVETRKWLNKDSRYFLHQSLSTPCLNVLAACDGTYIEDLQGHRLMDFHGNNVHQVGFGNRRVIEAIKAQMESLSFCTRRKARQERSPGEQERAMIGDEVKTLFFILGASSG